MNKTTGNVPLLIGFLAGPVVWGTHLLLSEVLISSACSSGQEGFHRFLVGSVLGWELVLLLFSLVFILLALAVDVTATRAWLETGIGTGASGDQEGVNGRSGWMALAGILVSTMFLIGIVAAAVPIFFLSGCG